MSIVKLSSLHAEEAARLHIAGQPGTFLTSLGPAVLTVLYRALPESPIGFGYAALADTSIYRTNPVLQSAIRNPHSAIPIPQSPFLTGFISATTSIGRLFAEMGTRRIAQFLPPLCARFARQPALLLRSVQTILYPFLAQQPHGRAPGATAELLSIMVAPDARHQGIGAQLMQALLAECIKRQITWLDVTVDAHNAGARRFYERHNFALAHQFDLYGRTMCSYQLALDSGRTQEPQHGT